MTLFGERSPLHVPALHLFEAEGLTYAVDGAAPNWIVVEPPGRELLRAIMQAGGKLTLADLTARYAASGGLDGAKAWLHVHDFVRALARVGLLADRPFTTSVYPGRLAMIQPDGLRELWLQLNNNCNLSCSHCLVGSGPSGEKGLPLERWIALIDRAAELG